MENTVFNKRLKIGTIIFAMIVAVLLIIRLSTKGGHDGDLSSDSHNTEDCCFNDFNYYNSLSIEDAIKSAYIVCGLEEDPSKYRNYEETLRPKYSRTFEFIFKTIDGYRIFLSDESACNKGKESLKSFICKMVQSDRSFLRSRSTGEVFEQLKTDELPEFKFDYMLYGNYGGTICSWEKITEGSASYVIADGMDVVYRYTFIRVDGLWYLTDFFENEWY